MGESTETLSAILKLHNFPEGAHWFCPRQTPNDQTFYFDEDLLSPNNLSEDEKQHKARLIDEAKTRRSLIIDTLKIFSFTGTDAVNAQQWLMEQLEEQLRRCEICIREFHRSREDLKERLESLYNPDNVKAFLEVFDNVNVERIERGLAAGTQQLRNLPANQRGIAALDRQNVYPLFEAFNCKAFCANETKLSQCFDEFFALVQTNRTLKLNSYSPAMFYFLFGSNLNRRDWAMNTLSKAKRNIAPIEFEHCVRQPLQNAMSHIQIFALEQHFLKQFWDGVNSIVRRLDGVQVAECLSTLQSTSVNGQNPDNNLCRLALHHLQVDDDALKSIAFTIEYILQVSPKSFWDALATIPMLAWVEQFFGSPALDRLRGATRPEEDSEDQNSSSEPLFGWIKPFLNSVSPISQAEICRALVGNLKRLVDNASFESSVQSTEGKLMLDIITISLENINRNFWNVLLPISRDVLSIVDENLSIMKAAGDKEAAEIFKQAITLDCKCLVSFSKPSTNIRDPKDKFIQYLSIWDAAFDSFKYRDKNLPKYFLNAIRPLAGVEAFVAKGQLTEEQKQFNDGLSKAHSIILQWLDRIGQFAPHDLQTFFMNPDMVTALMIALFLPNDSLQLALIDMIKTYSGKASRREAISYLLHHHLVLTLNGISRALRTLENAKTYTSSSSVLKPCSDAVDILCNNTDGILRSQSESLSEASRASTENFWESLWTFLTMVFSSVGNWSSIGHQQQSLEDLCRQTMEFADNVFDQFGVVKGAISSSSSPDIDNDQQTGKRLIKQPKLTTAVIVTWLKLRDEYLVTKSCALVCKLLIRLEEFGVLLDESSLEYVVNIAFDHERSTLSQQQKAELARALEKHCGMKPYSTSASPSDSKSKLSLPPSKSTYQGKGKIDLKQWASKADKQPPSVPKPTAPAKEKPSVTPTFNKVQRSGFPFRTNSTSVRSEVEVSDPFDFRKKREQELAERKKRDAIIINKYRKPQTLATPTTTAGSALKNIGVVGKEHETPKKVSTMMVSSGEEDSSSDESSEEDDMFFGSNTTNQKNNVLTSAQAKAMKKARGPVKKQRLVRSAKDMRARLSPDLSPLHKIILGWEYFHEGVFPPGCSAEDYSAVSDKFKDPHAYQQKFQSLLLLEAWNGFLKAREENSFKPYAIKVGMRSSVDSFFEVSSTMSLEEGKDISEGDILLLSKAKSPASSESELHCLSRVHKMARKKGHIDILYRTLPAMKMGAALLPGVTVYGLKIASIIPLEREYGALLGLQFYDLCDEIVQARPSPLLNYSDERLNPVMDNYRINKAQAKAVRCAIDNDAFTLVQGPPGSGKTKTIVAIVGALLSDSLKAETTLIDQPKVQGVKAAQRAPLKKLLVCAPSNAAVDELVMRFKEGIKTMDGNHHPLNVIRIGRSDAINAGVQDVTLDELVSKKLGVVSKEASSGQQTQKLMAEHKIMSEKLNDAQAKLRDAEAKGLVTKDLQNECNSLRREKALLGTKVDNAKEDEKTQHQQAEADRKKAQQEVLDSANVICATLSGSGHDLFLNLSVEFETVIIDEAAQCVEMSALIPLKYGCAKCVLVGDPQQLPPTIFSKDAVRFKYEQSLFVRMQRNHPEDVHLLDTQYRMHPMISCFPSKAFYGGKLLDGPEMRQLRTRPWHSTELLSPFRFFDVQGKHQSASTGHSLVNHAEVKVALDLYYRLVQDFPSWDCTGKIGIITPYKSQLRELRNAFKHDFGQSVVDRIEFNTTDAFQGRESEVIIFSCVRASPDGGIGFLQDVRRMNVGLTRAKSSLWVLGNSQSLIRGKYWAKLVENAQARQLYTAGNIQALLSKPLKVLPEPPEERNSAAPVWIDSAMEVDEKPQANTQAAPSTAKPDDAAAKKRRLSDPMEDLQANPTKKQASEAPPPEDSDVQMTTDSSPADTTSPSDYASPPSELPNVKPTQADAEHGENTKAAPVAAQDKPAPKPPALQPPRARPKKQESTIFIPKKRMPPRRG